MFAVGLFSLHVYFFYLMKVSEIAQHDVPQASVSDPLLLYTLFFLNVLPFILFPLLFRTSSPPPLYSTVSAAQLISFCSGWPTEWRSSPLPWKSSQSPSRTPNALISDDDDLHYKGCLQPVRICHSRCGYMRRVCVSRRRPERQT